MKNTQTLVGVLENNNKSTFRNSQKSIKAFSLIELSIVLIIMGLLVAGVTGGQSLIQSAKTRAVINEATGYKRAVNIFYAKNNRLPGDPDNTGRMGGWSEPWIEMASDGIVEYEEGNNFSTEIKDSKYIKKAGYKFTYTDTGYPEDFTKNFEEGLKNKNIMDFTAKYDGYIPASIAAGIEEKIDDKSTSTGDIRMGTCSVSIPESDIDDAGYPYPTYDDVGEMTYSELVNAKNGACDEIIFKLDL